MKTRLRILFWGGFISFLGSLPPGTMNIMVLHISIQRGIASAWVYSLGSMVAELLVVILALAGLRSLFRFQFLIRWLEALTLVLLTGLSIASFYAAWKGTTAAAPLLTLTGSSFWIGFLISLTNPLHLPFWMGWTTILVQKNVLVPGRVNYTWYVTGIGSGTLAGFLVFIKGGPFLMQQVLDQEYLLHLVIGTALLITAVLQFYKARKQSIQQRYHLLLHD